MTVLLLLFSPPSLVKVRNSKYRDPLWWLVPSRCKVWNGRLLWYKVWYAIYDCFRNVMWKCGNDLCPMRIMKHIIIFLVAYVKHLW